NPLAYFISQSKKMRRNCNLEFRLMPPSLSTFSPNICSNNNTSSYFSMEEDKESTELEQKSEPLTIFYNGKLVVSHVTDLQAKAIIYLASRETEEKTNKSLSPISEPSSPLLQPQTVKKSLQRFLQKRKSRTQTTSPYHH
uniref:Protein TIFY n=2 Tax=Solanum lycopersicum TaxID=4081 RepID=A0A3Q7HN62_SOLLC